MAAPTLEARHFHPRYWPTWIGIALIWLLSWLPGQHTDLHDHGGATGAFTVVSGTLTESTARQDGSGERSQQLVAGQSRAFGPNYIHQVRNLGVDPAVSIHVYRPFRVMTHYR